MAGPTINTASKKNERQTLSDQLKKAQSLNDNSERFGRKKLSNFVTVDEKLLKESTNLREFYSHSMVAGGFDVTS